MNHKSPSQTFLFDNYCTGRLKYHLGNLKQPEQEWEFNLRSYPAHCPESTPAFDIDGNIYFGAHDGCFYSLTPNGQLRWMFKTGAKIYSSPAIVDELGVFVASGDGHLYSFDFSGALRWSYNLCVQKKASGFWGKHLQAAMISYMMYDPNNRRVEDCKVWASPKVTKDKHILITGMNGLHAIESNTGELCWKFSMEGFQYNRSGVAIGPDKRIYTTARRRYLHCLDPDGTLIWTLDTKIKYESWGCPSIDPDTQSVFFSLSQRENQGEVFATDFSGQLKWRLRLPTALRGSVTITYADYVVVCGFDGKLYFLKKQDGTVIKALKFTKARRGLWTTVAVDPSGHLLFTVKDTPYRGSVYCLDRNGKIKWQLKTGKALSTPVIDHDGRLFFGSWQGKFICIRT